MLQAPVAFQDNAVESRFLSSFREAGRIFSAYGFALGALLAFTAWLMLEIGVLEHPTDRYMQSGRLMCTVVLSLCISILVIRPELADRYYLVIVGGGLMLVMAVVGVMGIWDSFQRPGANNKLLLAFVLACWLGNSFTRLPAKTAGAIYAFPAVLIYIGEVIREPGQYLGILMYISVSILVGWVSNVQIERRERKLFQQAESLSDLSTELKSRLTELELLGQDRVRVLHGIVHDLRQPLLSMELFLNAWRRGIDNEKSNESRIQKEAIQACFLQLQSGVDAITHRGISGKSVELNLIPMDVVYVASQAIELLRPLAIDSGVQIHFFSRNASGVHAYADRSALRTVLINLVENAIKFKSSGLEKRGRVHVSIVLLDDRLRISVIDDGVGILESEVGHVFQTNWRSNEPSIKRIRGSGLGLSIAKELVTEMGGQIAISSRYGAGTRVRIYLPRRLAAESK